MEGRWLPGSDDVACSWDSTPGRNAVDVDTDLHGRCCMGPEEDDCMRDDAGDGEREERGEIGGVSA